MPDGFVKQVRIRSVQWYILGLCANDNRRLRCAPWVTSCAAPAKKKLSLEQLAGFTDSQQELYLGAGEPRRSQPVGRQDQQAPQRLDVTTEVPAQPHHRSRMPRSSMGVLPPKYKAMPESTKKQIRKILDAWDDDE